MSSSFLKRPGARRARNAAGGLLLLSLLAGCMYSFVGGGLPSHVRRVYIQPFENETPYQTLTSDLLREMQEKLPGSLGVRLASEQTADAVVRGTLKSAEEQTTNFDPQPDPTGRISRLEARVQISFDAEIYDVRNDKVLWRGNGITAIGNFEPGREDVDDGRAKALQQVVQKLIEGAQSQW
ncbi:MAG TPA: LPS assembly lipoprotein LptE [Longimicrobium sp.]|nr:LPS assembly lipoprotein LptE [Longimicrobium sp.]